MSAYVVTLRETLEYELTVEADSAEQASETAEEIWRWSENPEEEFGYSVVESIDTYHVEFVSS